MKALIIDFETRSRCDLKKSGVYNYALDLSTDILCCAFVNLSENDPRQWLWSPGELLPTDLIEVIQTSDFVMAHNAQFDRLIWECIAVPDYDFPPVSLERWYCTAAQMRCNNLPAALEKAAVALDRGFRKDVKGRTLIAKLSKPSKKTGEFNNDPELLKAMREYCLQDAIVTRDLVRATSLLSAREHSDWLVNERINDRGVLIDVALAKKALGYRGKELDILNNELSVLTKGVAHSLGQRAVINKWVRDQCGDGHPINDYMCKLNDAGEVLYSLDANIRKDILQAIEADELTIPSNVAHVIEILDNASFSSVVKFKNMLHRADEETHRLHGAFVFAGGSTTKRFSSKGLQLHNFPRASFSTIDETWTHYDRIMADTPIADPLLTLKKLLRHALMAPDGHWFVTADWTGIEARVLPWLADTKDAHIKLEKLAQGVDIYVETAHAIGLPDRRDIGKTSELACGYGGALGAFKQFAQAFRIELSNAEITTIIERWRNVNAWAVDFWYALERAAHEAVRYPGEMITCRRLRYLYNASLMKGTLWCVLPDESIIVYPMIEVDRSGGRPQLTCLNSTINKKQADREWPRMRLYGGALAGHVTQATAGALLRHALRTLDQSGLNVVAHVHDEVIVEVSDNDISRAFFEVKRIMNETPPWADGLPIHAAPAIMERFRKD